MTLVVAQPGCIFGGANKDGSKMKEVEKLSAEIPVHPALSPNGYVAKISKPQTALITRHYKSTLPYEELMNFYVEKLTADGWKFEGDSELRDWGKDLGGYELEFRRGGYFAAITYAGEKADYGWDYSIDVGWDE